MLKIQLISTELYGGWRDRVWSSCFAEVLFLKESIYIALQYGERYYGGGGGWAAGGKSWSILYGGGGGAGKLKMFNVQGGGWIGDRTVPLFVKATVEVVQDVG